MRTAPRHASRVLRWAAACICTLGPLCAWAETPGEIPKPWTYEGSMKLQQQQQQSNQQWQATQQQQQQQADQQWQATQQQQQAQQNAAVAQGQAVLRTWQKRPPLPADHNPLLGRWDSRGSSAGGAKAPGGGDLAKLLGPEMAGMAQAMLGGMTQGLCDSMLGRGPIEFRPTGVVALGRDGRERLLYHAEYRGGGSRVVVLPQGGTTFTHMIVDFDSSDHATVAAVGCILVRAGASHAGAGQAPAPAYQGTSLQAESRPASNQVDLAALAATAWESVGRSLKGETEFFVARSTIRHYGDSIRMWEMIDKKAATNIVGKPVHSVRNLYEYDCRGARRRMLAAAAYSGHVGKGTVVGSEFFANPFPWQGVGADAGYSEYLFKMVCAKG
ncbi:MAG: surface-adhesin E family protein [Caldimonas sp.]